MIYFVREVNIMQWIISGMIFAGSILMVYNIYGFVHFARYVRGLKSWNQENSILNIPIVPIKTK